MSINNKSRLKRALEKTMMTVVLIVMVTLAVAMLIMAVYMLLKFSEVHHAGLAATSFVLSFLAGAFVYHYWKENGGA